MVAPVWSFEKGKNFDTSIEIEPALYFPPYGTRGRLPICLGEKKGAKSMDHGSGTPVARSRVFSAKYRATIRVTLVSILIRWNHRASATYIVT